jgi:hypothetical protein
VFFARVRLATGWPRQLINSRQVRTSWVGTWTVGVSPSYGSFASRLCVVAVVLVLRPEDQAQVARVGHQDSGRERPEQVVVGAVPATGLVADLEAAGQPLQCRQNLLDASHLGAVDDLAVLVEGANRDARAVDVETDVEHGCLPKIGFRTHTSRFHVNRSTGTPT